MFEKESEEWVKKNMDCCKTDNSVNQSIPYFDEEERCIAKSAFQDGAEFGYNKAKEWHFPSKGEYPKEDCEVIILHENGKKNIQKWKNGGWTNAIVIPIIAWKEIVLPELKESEFKSEMFPEITLPEGSSEFIDKVIADAEKRVKESE